MNQPSQSAVPTAAKATPTSYHSMVSAFSGKGAGSSYHQEAQAFIKNAHAHGREVTRSGSDLNAGPVKSVKGATVGPSNNPHSPANYQKAMQGAFKNSKSFY